MRQVEPYILSGRFKEWALPTEVLQSYLTRYYMGENDSPETFARVVSNFNMVKCSKEVVMVFIRHAEKHFLTSTVIDLYTRLFDRKEVSLILCSSCLERLLRPDALLHL